MATIACLNLTTPRLFARASESSNLSHLKGSVQFGLGPSRFGPGRVVYSQPVRAAPDSIDDKVEKSIEDAKQTCADDPKSGECVAAWDEVEELSAAASHARDKKKAGGNDPLENYCKDNPETDECRTYDN